MKFLPIIVVAALLLIGCSEEKNDQVDDSQKPETLTKEFDETEMDAAIEKARSRVDEFLKVFDEGGADYFSVKAPIEDAEGIEHFWIVNISYSDGVFSGEIGNDPGIVKNVKAGQAWQIKKEEISDWMYMKGERIHGGFTIDPLLESMPEGEAEVMRSKLVR